MNWTPTRSRPFELIGGRLCLDFINTTHCHGCDDPRDDLMNYLDLVLWSRQLEIVSPREAQDLLRQAKNRTTESARVLKQAKTLRDILFRMFSALASQRRPNKTDIVGFNQALSEAMSNSEIVLTKSSSTWSWNKDDSALDRLLWPVIRSAADLLVSDEIRRLRRCGGNDCTWLFLDLSKNTSRRWCDMKECGNRAKARRHYKRKRAVS